MGPAGGSWRTFPPRPPFALSSQSLIRGSTTSPYSFTDHLLVFGCGGREQRGEASLQNRSVVTPVLVLNSLTRKKIISDGRFPSASPQNSWGRDGGTTGSGAAPSTQPTFSSLHGQLTHPPGSRGGGKPAQAPARPGSQRSFAIISKITSLSGQL